MKNKLCLLLLILACTLAETSPARAEEDTSIGGNSCDTSCPDNQKKVGYGDGNSATCVCVDQGSGMVDTQVDDSAQSPGLGDGEPLASNNVDQVAPETDEDNDENENYQY